MTYYDVNSLNVNDISDIIVGFDLSNLWTELLRN